ncbi:MAG: MFS transporter, partial [Chitinophagales bacterium]
MANFQKGDKKIINAWAMYDWANSVYSLVITVAVFPIYYNAITTTKDDAGNITSDLVSFLGMEFVNTELYSYIISFSFFVMVILSPILSAIADSTGRQKMFMRIFCYLGSFSCMYLFFFTPETFEAGMIAFAFASIGFTGSIVFYNSYLPVIAEPEDHDRISAKGFSMGYIGSVILLVFNLVMIQKPELFGITDSALPARISFLTVGIWWFLFAHIPFHYLPNNVFKKEVSGNIFFKGYQELGKVFRQLKNLPRLRNFIFAFFFYSMGVQTVIYLASSYGTKELGIETAGLLTKPTAVFEKNGIKYGFAAFAPNSGTVDVRNITKAKAIVSELAKQSDIVIVSFHGGAEGSKYEHVPHKTEYFYGENRGNVEQFAHAVIDAGADIVFGHGPHVTRAVEVYKERFITYSMGNFATYGRFNLRGPNGIAPLYKLTIDSEGK